MRHRNPRWSELCPSLRRKIRTDLRVMLRDNKFNEAALQRDIGRQAENKTRFTRLAALLRFFQKKSQQWPPPGALRINFSLNCT